MKLLRITEGIGTELRLKDASREHALKAFFRWWLSLPCLL